MGNGPRRAGISSPMRPRSAKAQRARPLTPVKAVAPPMADLWLTRKEIRMDGKSLALKPAAAVSAALLAMATLGTALPAAANDSTASLDADGLHFTYNPNIEILSEALSLGLDWISVDYRFHNTSDHDISTLIAFPLPVMFIGEEGNYVLPDNRDPINFIDFQ